MIDNEEFEEEQFDNEKATFELKKALFEICKTEFDRSSAYSRLLDEYGSLVVDVFSDNPFETEPAFADFYDFNDYEDTETGECRTFSEWADYFANQNRKELAPLVFEMLKSNHTEEAIIRQLQSSYSEVMHTLSIYSKEDLKSYMEYEEFEDDLLGIEQTLLEWKEFFINDEFDLYGTCKELTEQNEVLLKKLNDIKSIIDKND